MTRQQIRAANLRRLHAEAGAWKPLAEAAGTSTKYLSLVATETLQDGKPRSLGNEYVERLEAAYSKFPGWFDINHDNPPGHMGDMAPGEQELIRLWRLADKRLQEMIMALAAFAMRNQ